MTGIGKRIRAARRAAEIPATALAKTLGVSRNAVTRWESGLDTPDPQRLPQIADALGVSVGELAGDVSRDTQTQPAPAAGMATGAGPDLEGRSADFWAGRQSALLDMLQFASQLQRQAAEWQDRAIAAQRELIEHTTPTPRPIPPVKAADATPAPRPAEGATKRRRANG